MSNGAFYRKYYGILFAFICIKLLIYADSRPVRKHFPETLSFSAY